MPIVYGEGRERAPGGPNAPELGMQKFVEGQINQGMITMFEPTNIPPSALALAKNANVRYDRTQRRAGSYLFVPTKPDTNGVLAVVFTKDQLGNGHIVRITASTAQYVNSGVWQNLAIGAGLHGTATDLIDCCNVLDTFIFSNNGADPLQTIDFGANTVAQLGNAPAYRTVTGFFNRAVGFARKAGSEVEVGWSGDGAVTQWDPTIDESAGSTPLLDTPDDLADHIKHGMAATNVMVILREKSIWLATKQPIAQNPFYFYSAVPGLGCDCPYSAQIIIGGVAWTDRRTGSVYAYGFSGLPEAIGRPVEKTLLAGITNPETVFSGYDASQNEYTVFIPQSGSQLVAAWTFNFRTKAWTYNEYYRITSANDTELAQGGTRIEDLIGTIAGLQGTISALSHIDPGQIARAFGCSDGSIAIEDPSFNLDAPQTGFANGVAFDTVLQSKTFKIPSNDIYVAQVVLEYRANKEGTFTLEYSKDDGKTWLLGKTVFAAVTNQSQLLIFRKMIRCRRFTWRITTQAAQFETLSYEVYIYPSGLSRR